MVMKTFAQWQKERGVRPVSVAQVEEAGNRLLQKIYAQVWECSIGARGLDGSVIPREAFVRVCASGSYPTMEEVLQRLSHQNI